MTDITSILEYYSNKSGFTKQGKEVTPSLLRNSFISHSIRARGISQTKDLLGLKHFRIYEFGHFVSASLSSDSLHDKKKQDKTPDGGGTRNTS